MGGNMDLHGNNLVAGEWVSGNAPNRFRSANPTTGEALEPFFHDADQTQVQEACAQAQEAFLEFKKVPVTERANLLETLADEVESRADTILLRAQKETALGEPRLQMELARTVAQPRLFAKLIREGSWVDARIDRSDPSRQPLPRPSLRSMLQPIGPIAVFGASNFPLAISVSGTDTVCAFAAGCPVIIKAHPAHPGTCEATAEAVLAAIRKHDLPPGLFSLLHGQSTDVGQSIVAQPGLAAVAFTGSLTGGRALMDAAAARKVPIPVFAEMGSLNPVFLLPGALRENGPRIAEGFVQALTLGVGQFCTNPAIVLATDTPELDNFVAQAVEHISASNPATMLHEGIHRNYHELGEKFRNTPRVQIIAQTTTADSGRLEADACLLETDYVTWTRTPELRQECFGPTAILIRARNEDELIDFARQMEGSLTATLHATQTDLDRHHPLRNLLESRVGRLVYNGFPPGVEIGHATHHGGPYPATSTGAHTSIGTGSIRRFVRPVCYQNCPDSQLPAELQDANPLGISRTLDGHPSRSPASK